MIDSLHIAATGMQVQQMSVDTIANNLTNASTPAFKRGRVNFSDLLIRETARATDAGQAQGLDATSRTGTGVATSGVTRSFEQGDLRKTGAAFDVAISGEGFIEVAMPDGSRAFTRGGTLMVNKDGLLATQSGLPLKVGVSIPDGIQDLTIQADGRVFAKTSANAQAVELGQIELVRFQNPLALTQAGDGLYRAPDAAGQPVSGKPSDEGFGSLAQGSLEGSNVKLVDEMVNLMVAQRAYEASAKVVQTSDEMLGLINNLRR